ncbi:DUF2470 domain-containing protein [Streptomyces wuyuanensis]|uniref:DUF2470 domain-containing protein n=1 Tax=Streptomyces wuyuanensis TaxID=1196353 RepID=UPI00379CF127
MVLVQARAGAPSNAERIRSVVAASGSLSLTTGSRAYDLVALHTVDDLGVLRLHAPADSVLALESACAPAGELTALVEFTDLAPVRVRDRVRSRVTLAGRLGPSGTRTEQGVLVLRLETVRASIARGGVVEHVGPAELARATVDLLAFDEAGMLAHLDEDHPELVAELGRLVDPGCLRGAVALRPLALDRHGITLRCEYAGGHQDVRIAFPAPLRSAEDIRRQMDRLLARAARAGRDGGRGEAADGPPVGRAGGGAPVGADGEERN